MKDEFNSTITENLKPYKLPENWNWFFWEDIMHSYQQGMIRSNSQLGKGNVEYLKMGDIDSSGTADLSKLNRTESTDKEILEYELKEGDFLINVRNSLSLVGKTCVIDKLNQGKTLYNHMLVRINNGSTDMNYFINAFLNVPTSKKMLDRIKEGTTTVIALYQRELNKLPIALPDFKTFSVIVKLYKSLRLKIELNNKINAELETMAKLIYDYWFVQFDFPISAAQATAMGKPELEGKPYKSSGGKMVYNQALKREIPEGWEDGILGDFAEIIGGSTPSKSNEEYFTKSGIPWITPKDLSINSGKKFITKGEIDVSEMGSKAASLKIMPPNTVLMSSRAPIGYLAISRENITTNQGFKSFVPNKGYSSEYLYHTLMRAMPLIEANASGSTFREVSSGVLKNLLWPKPQRSLVELYTERVSSIFQKQNILEKQNQELISLRDWLLPMLMNGQVTIKEAEERVSMVAEPEEAYGGQN